MRLLFAALTTFLLLDATAMASCPGQTGKVIFEDTFADDSGGWMLGAPDREIKDGALLLRPNPRGSEETGTWISSVNLTFSATEGDYCVEFVVPKPVAADNDMLVGLVFWVSPTGGGESDRYLLSKWMNGRASLRRLNAGTWSPIFSQDTGNLEPDKISSLRVVAKDGKLTLFVDGTQIKVVRAPTPTGNMQFGVGAQAEKASEANPVVQIKSFKVTTGK